MLTATVLSSNGIISAFAETVSTPTNIEFESALEEKRDFVYEDVYRQLKEQNATDLFDIYKEILEPQIEAEVLADFGIQLQSSNSYVFNHGGYVTYLKPLSGYKPTEVAVTCLDINGTNKYIYNMKKITMESILMAYLGEIPKVGAVLDILSLSTDLSDLSSIGAVSAAGGYGEIINTHSYEFDEKASIFTGWRNHPYYTLPSGATNVHWGAFTTR